MPVKKRRYQNKNILVATSAVFAIVVVVGGFYYAKIYKSNNSVPTDQTSQLDGEINLSPPTEEEKNPARDSRTEPKQVNTSEGTKNQVTPAITSADEDGARAFVPEVNENDGTCTATFKRNQESPTAISKGFSDVSYTSCNPMTLTSPLSRGTWIVTVSYSSPTSQGESEPFTFEVK